MMTSARFQSRLPRRVSKSSATLLTISITTHSKVSSKSPPKTNMPSRPKRRAPSDRVYTSEPNARQVHFPCRKRSINPAKPTPPTSRTRQQTLTQIDFVTRYVPPDEDIDLNYIEEEREVPARRKRRRILPDEDAPTAVRGTDPSKEKRRKTLPAPGTATAVDTSSERTQRRTLPVEDTRITIETRASKRRKIKKEPENENNATAVPKGTQSNAADIQPRPVRGEMTTPRTPVTARKVEIPSSQSPADSPLSTQKTASFPSPVRSPLRARSTNLRVPLKAGLKGRKLTGWHPKLEVKSSVSWENEDSQPLTVASFLTTAEQRDYDLDRSDTVKGVEGGQEGDERPQCAVQGPIRSTEPTNRPTPTPLPLTAPQFSQSSKTEIRDSDEEEEEDEDEEGRSPHSTTNTTQSIEHESSQFQHPLLSTKSICQAPTPSTDAADSSPEHSHAEPSAPAENPTSSSCEPKPKDKDDNTQKNRNIPSPINTKFSPLSSAEAASAQLSNDLHQETQNQLESGHDEHTEGLDPPTPTSRLLDSQSQFGFICRDYTPSPSRSPPSIPPIATTLHATDLGPKPKPNATSRSRSLSSSPTNHPGTSQALIQSPLLSRSLPLTTFPGPPAKPPHLQTSQISTQSQSQLPRKSPALPAPSQQHPQYPQPQHRPSYESWPSFSLGHTDGALPPLPGQNADSHPEQEQQQGRSLSPCPSAMDIDADFLPPQTFLQSSPLLAPSLSIYDYERGGDKFGDGDVMDDERAEDGGDGEGSWDGNVKTTSQFLPESIFDDESQELGLRLPPGFSSQLLELE